MYTCLTFVFGPEFLPILGTGGVFLFVDFRVRPFQKETTCEDEVLMLSNSDSLSLPLLQYFLLSNVLFTLCYFSDFIGFFNLYFSCILRNELWQEEKKECTADKQAKLPALCQVRVRHIKGKGSLKLCICT